MSDKKLSEDLKYWRAQRPDEWIMDRFIKEAIRLEALESKSHSDNKQSEPLLCDECGAEMFVHHNYCWQCGCNYKNK